MQEDVTKWEGYNWSLILDSQMVKNHTFHIMKEKKNYISHFWKFLIISCDTVQTNVEYPFKVDQHSVLNGLSNEDSAIKLAIQRNIMSN